MKFQHYLSAILLFSLTLSPCTAQAEPPTPQAESSFDILVRDANAGDAYSARQLYMRFASTGQMQTAKKWADRYAEILKHQAEAGDSKAMLRLGASYLDGRDMFPLSREQSLAWFSKASASGEPSGAYILAEIYKEDGSPELAQQHYARAFELYTEQLADKARNADALYWLGMMQLDGLGTEPSLEQAINKLEQAAQLNNKWAYTQLFKLFADGTHTPRDEKRALVYAQKLADDFNDALMAYAVACAYLNGQGVAKDEATGERYLDQACKLNVADAIMLKASRLEQAGKLAEAIPYYKQAASMAQKDAVTRIGALYLKGEGIDKDEEQGVALLTSAAERFQSQLAALELAYYYDRAEEPSLADHWYVIASERGVAQAMARRGLMHLNPYSEMDWNPTLAYRWWKAGSDAGDAESSRYINYFIFGFIPLMLVICFLGPILLMRYLSRNKAKPSEQ